MPKQKRQAQYYWVKTGGYHSEYTPLYFNGESWKVSINDRDLFISDYKLELLFGKNSILRAINQETDLKAQHDNLNAFYPALLKADSGNDIVFMVHGNIHMAIHNGMLVPMPEFKTDLFMHYPEGKEND